MGWQNPRSRFAATTRRKLLMGLVVALAVSLPALTVDAASPLTPIKLQLKWFHQSQFAGFYFADRKGFFRDEGLQVEMIEGGPKIDSLEPLRRGEVDFTIASASQLIAAEAGNLAVMAVYRRNPTVFFSSEALDVTRPDDLKGKTIRTNASGLADLHSIMAGFGFAEGDYEPILLPSKLEDFKARPDIVWTGYSTGFLYSVQQSGAKVDLIFPDDYRVHIPGDTLVTRSDFAAQHPDIVEGFIRASVKGWRMAMRQAGAVGVLVSEYAADANVERETKTMLLSLPLLHDGDGKVGLLEPENWRWLARTLKEVGEITADVDVEALVTNKFVEPNFR